MPDDEEPEVIDSPVDIVIDQPDEAPEVETGDTVVTVITPEAPEEGTVTEGELERAVDDALTMQALDQRITALELAQIEDVIEEAEEEAAIEEVIADAAEAEAEAEENAEEIEELKDEISPDTHKTHPLFRSAKEWRAGK